MSIFFSSEHRDKKRVFRDFIDKEIAPFAHKHDSEQQVSRDLIEKVAGQGYLGATVSPEYGGSGMDMVTFGLLSEELGRRCSSVRSLITVQMMVAQVIERWGREEQKQRWLKTLACGEKIAALALTEPEFGSDAGGIQTKIDSAGDSFLIHGTKKWITFGQIADVFLLLGRNDDKLCAVLVEKGASGLSIEPIRDILGVRGSMLAQLQFNNCKIPKSNLIGSIGFGLYPIAFTALDIGRYSIACGCVGLAQASLEAAVDYAKSRKQFGNYLRDHQLVQEKIANMVTDIRSARLLCYNAGYLKQINDRDAFREMLIAKYYASNMAIRVTNLSVEIHGANGYSSQYPVERYLRDAKIMETIEGTNQMLQIMISKYDFKDYAVD